MKSKTTFFSILMLLSALHLWSQDRKSINDQNYIYENKVWKQIDSESGKSYPLSDEITIQFKRPPSKAQIRTIEQSYNATFMRSNRLGFYDFKLEKTKVLDGYQRMVNEIKAEQIFTNTIGTYILTPNDPQYGTQWALEQISDADIDAEDAWDITTGNSSVIVAILDSGTDWTHEDLGLGSDTYQNVYLNPGEDAWSNPNDPTTGNGIDDDGNGFIDDWKGWDFHNSDNDSRGPFWHGTHVAGIVSAKSNNSTGIAGIAGGNNGVGARLMLEGVGDSAPNASILDDAIIYAMDNGADVIQLSLGVGSSPAIDAAILNAYNAGVFIVCSSGNGGTSTIGYPASNPNVFSVGATTATDTRAGFSQFGTNLDLAAPGVGILSTQIGNTYATSDGTSFASPQVSGTVALMLSVDPTLTNQAIEDILKCTAEKVGGYNYNWNASEPGHSQELGYGRLNAHLAVQAVSTGDIYIRDTAADDGTEPSTGIMWTSPDIWVRNDDDGGTTHENPEYKLFSPNWVYIRVNRKDCSNVDDAEVRLYFSKASTGLSWPLHWDNYYQMVGPNNILHGDFVGATSVPTSPDDEIIVKIPWYPPNPADFTYDVHHFCLLARIISAKDPIGVEGTSVNTNTRNNNNIAWKNVSVYDINGFDNVAPAVFVRNVEKWSRTVNLQFVVADNTTGIPFEKLGDFYIIPDEKLNEYLANTEMRGIKRVDRNMYQVVESKAEIFKLAIEPFETYGMQLLVKPQQEIKEGRFLTYDIIQYNEERQETGGERYTIGNFGKEKQTGVDENVKPTAITQDIVLSPNPTTGRVTIKMGEQHSLIELEVNDMAGNTVFTKVFKRTDNLEFDLKTKKGLYLVKVTIPDGNTSTFKVIKE